MAFSEKYKYQGRYYEKNKKWAKERRETKRREVVAGYGGKCVCCGESEYKFLTLDHPRGDGQEDRAKYRNSLDQIYGYVIKNNFPMKYSLLCMNCNWVRRYDICPHEVDKTINKINT